MVIDEARHLRGDGRQARQQGVDAVKAEIAAFGAQQGVTVDPTAPVVAMLDLIVIAYADAQAARPDIEKMTKAELVDHAKEKHGVDLDGKMNKDDLLKAVKALDAGLGNS